MFSCLGWVPCWWEVGVVVKGREARRERVKGVVRRLVRAARRRVVGVGIAVGFVGLMVGDGI